MMMWFVASLLMSCSHKDIDCPAPEAQIEVVFEWDKAHNAAVDGMTLFFTLLTTTALHGGLILPDVMAAEWNFLRAHTGS